MIIVSGPSTVGKNPFIYRACEIYGLEYVVPATTRQRRIEEKHNEDYSFYQIADFQSSIKEGRITEWDYCLGNYYGYTFNFPGKPNSITHGLSRMAIRIKMKYPEDITTIFLMPANITKIIDTLEQIYTGDDLVMRKKLVYEEMRHASMFDKVFECDSSAINIVERNDVKDYLHHLNII